MTHRKSFWTLLLALGCSTLLSACLPEDKDPAKMAQSAAGKQESGGFYGAALGNVAMQLQNAVVSDPNWFVTMTGSQELNLAAMNIRPEGLPADVKSHMCKTDVDTQWMQVTWIDGRDSSNNFALKGIGDNGATLMSSLRARVSSNQLGTALGNNRLAMSNYTTTTIPTDCGALDIPVGAPVIAFLIDQPATPTTTLSRTEYRSVDCNPLGTAEEDKTMTGTRVQKRTVNYDSDGNMTVTVNGAQIPYTATAGWSDDDMGECINAVRVAATTTEGSTGAGSSLDSFANMAVVLKGILDAQIRSMTCKRSTVTASNSNSGATSTMGVTSGTTSIDTCANGATVAGNTQVAEANGTNADTDEKTLSCKATIASTWASTIGGLPGSFATSVVWTGNATLVRDRADKVVAGKTNQVKVDRWIGKTPGGVVCDVVENLDADCQRITGAPTLVSRSNTKIVNTTLPVDRDGAYWGWSDPNDGGKDDLFVEGGGVSLNDVRFRGWGWGRTFNCSAAWALSFYYNDCMYAGIMYADYFNAGWFNDTSATIALGAHAEKPSQSRDWSDRILFKPRITTTGSWDLKTVQCEWAKREAIADCPSLIPLNNTQGSWNPYVLNHNNPHPKAVLGRSYGAYYGGGDPELPAPFGGGGGMLDSHYWLVEHLNRQYAQMTAQGHIVRQLVRPYHKYTNKACFLIGDCSTHIWNNVYIGPGTDTQFLKAWYNWPSNGVQTTLLNTDGMRRRTIAYENTPNNIVVAPVAGLAGYLDPVHCGQGAAVSETRYRYVTVVTGQYCVSESCGWSGCSCNGYANTYGTQAQPVTISGTWAREWRSDLGWSRRSEYYTSSPNVGSWSSYGAIPASF